MSNEINELLSNLSPDEYQTAIKILEEVSDNGTSNTLSSIYNEDFIETPVDIDTFIESPEYAGWFTNNGVGIYPYWRERLREIFNGYDEPSEICFSGSIGSGKSHIAVLGLAYSFYWLMCLKDPYKYFGLAKGSNIYIVFFNATLSLSQGVAYTKFQSLLQNSPWFMRHGKLSGIKNVEYVPDGPITFATGSQMEHSIGKDIYLAILDEVNFVKGADIQMEKSKMMKLYSSVLERVRSRFTIYGKVRGKVFLVSSKKSEYDFLEQYIKKQIGKPGVFVAEAVLFRVKPQGTYSGKMFKVAVGYSNMPSKIIQDTEDPESYTRQGYDVMDVPIEFKSTFELDMETSLMNILGISVSGVTKFFTYEIVSRCYNKNAVNPFYANVLTIGMNDKLKIQDFLDFSKIDPELVSKPIFIHLDASTTGDRTGLSAIAAVGYRYQNEYDIVEAETVTTKELVYRHVFSIAIQCPAQSEISFQKTRNFIYFLKNTLHWNIKAISTDGYQSTDTRQSLITMGFDDVSLVSLDRTPNGYLTLKAAVVERRITLLEIQELETEFIQLERNNVTGKCDHPVDGSKDILDSVAGATYNASLHEQELNIDLPEIISDITIDINNDAEDYTDSLLNKLIPVTKVTDITAINDNSNIIDNQISLSDAVHDYINSMNNNNQRSLPELVDGSEGGSNNIQPDEEALKKAEEERINAMIARARALQEGTISADPVVAQPNSTNYDNLMIF